LSYTEFIDKTCLAGSPSTTSSASSQRTKPVPPHSSRSRLQRTAASSGSTRIAGFHRWWGPLSRFGRTALHLELGKSSANGVQTGLWRWRGPSGLERGRM